MWFHSQKRRPFPDRLSNRLTKILTEARKLRTTRDWAEIGRVKSANLTLPGYGGDYASSWSNSESLRMSPIISLSVLWTVALTSHLSYFHLAFEIEDTGPFQFNTIVGQVANDLSATP